MGGPGPTSARNTPCGLVSRAWLEGSSPIWSECQASCGKGRLRMESFSLTAPAWMCFPMEGLREGGKLDHNRGGPENPAIVLATCWYDIHVPSRATARRREAERGWIGRICCHLILFAPAEGLSVRPSPAVTRILSFAKF